MIKGDDVIAVQPQNVEVMESRGYSKDAAKKPSKKKASKKKAAKASED